ncbi:MAG: hypothetical protein CVT86_08095 [Alphaproteobacteria bacterium HGW-Alphaproteobacteria-8]|jgi:outer membrane protein OmpU|nr:MAG: hypothetical protein CVT86_08095 [Alphaproteobacteria bacterium HGW-Alphaproteobacteria-8]
MKKLLIASTALVMVAGAAAAEVKVTGDARMGLSYQETTPAKAPTAAQLNAVVVADAAVAAAETAFDTTPNTANLDALTAARATQAAANAAVAAATVPASLNDWTAEYRVRTKFNLSGKTDSGLGFGASFIVNGTKGVADVTGSSMVWVSGAWGTVSVGEGVDAGSDSVGLGIADIGYKGIGVDDLAEGLYAATAANINYTGTFGAITVGLSYDLPVSRTVANSGDWSLGVAYKGDGFKVALGYDAGTVNTLTIGGGVTMGAISANVIYSMPDVGNDAYGLDFGYKLNSATVITAAYANNGTDDAYGVGVAYTLGGGAKMVAGLGSVAGVTKAEVGMTFSF